MSDKRGCLCGKDMHQVIKTEEYILWACDKLGCGRLLLEDARGELAGTWYLAEKRDEERVLG